MDFFIVGIIVFAAVFFSVRSFIKTFKGNGGCNCASGCTCTSKGKGCGTAPFPIVNKK